MLTSIYKIPPSSPFSLSKYCKDKCSLSPRIDPNDARSSVSSRDPPHDLFTCAKYFTTIHDMGCERPRAVKCIYLSLRLQAAEDAWEVTPAKYNRDSAGLPVRERTLQRVPEEGILKKSSAFLASLAHHHPSSKLAERNLPDDELAKFLRPTNSYELRDSSTSRYTSLKRYFLTDGDDNVGLCALRPSPSVQTLSTSLKKKSVGVKKSVSFSSDTSFQEKRVPYRKPAVHEVKVYRKGVLQGELSAIL